jgi:hypothetical protein
MIKFELVGEKIDIEDLQYVLNESEWSIKKEDSKYYLCTKTLNATSEKKEIVRTMNILLVEICRYFMVWVIKMLNRIIVIFQLGIRTLYLNIN